MHKVLKRFTAFAALGLASASPAWAGVIDLDKIETRVQEIMQKPGMVGLSLAVVEDGELVFAKGYGETVKGSGDLVTADTVFRWASVSKSVAAATVMELSEDGYLNVNEPAQLYAPSLKLPKTHKSATIEDIMAHRTGITRNTGDRKIEAGKFAKPLREKLNKAKRVCAPGTCHTYQNVAYDATAEIAETATGLPYKAIVNERIFKPLDMTTATTTLAGLQRSKSWARPHFRSGKAVKAVLPTYYRIPGAAGVNSSVTDLAKWMTAQMNGNEEVLSQAVHTAMQTPRVKTPREERYMRRRYDGGANANYGYGWRIYDYKGHRLVGHRGAVMGYRALVLFDPELKTGVAMLWNTGTGYPVELQMDVMNMALATPEEELAQLIKDHAAVDTEAKDGTGSP